MRMRCSKTRTDRPGEKQASVRREMADGSRCESVIEQQYKICLPGIPLHREHNSSWPSASKSILTQLAECMSADLADDRGIVSRYVVSAYTEREIRDSGQMGKLTYL